MFQQKSLKNDKMIVPEDWLLLRSDQAQSAMCPLLIGPLSEQPA
jgi:hypothetical protein